MIPLVSCSVRRKAWLLHGVANSEADFIFIICPDPFVLYHTAYHVDPDRGGVPKGDGFSSFVHEREQLIESVRQAGQAGAHLHRRRSRVGVVQITDNVWEMMCGPMGSTNHPARHQRRWDDAAGRRLGQPGPVSSRQVDWHVPRQR